MSDKTRPSKAFLLGEHKIVNLPDKGAYCAECERTWFSRKSADEAHSPAADLPVENSEKGAPSTPNPELEAALDALVFFVFQDADDGRDDASEDATNARSRLGSLYSRLQQERDDALRSAVPTREDGQ